MKILKSRIPFETFMILFSILFLLLSNSHRITDIFFGFMLGIGFWGLVDSILTINKNNNSSEE